MLTACPTSDTSSPKVVVTNSFANSSYVWFDVTLQDSSKATVDFLAIKNGDTSTDKSKTTVTSMEDTNGPELLAGRHFRDVFKPEESHRVVLYNLDPASTYDIYGYFREDSGAFANYDESVLVTLTTTAEFTEQIENVDQIAYVGQNLIIPGTSSITLNNDKTEQAAWGILPDYAEVFTMLPNLLVWVVGINHDDDLFSNFIVVFDKNSHYYLVITEINQNQQGLYKDYAVLEGSDIRYGINLEIRENL